jgi:hypothetical protein
MATLIPNNGAPLKNAEYGPYQNLPTRRERRQALRQFKKQLKKHIQFKIKQGIRVPATTCETCGNSRDAVTACSNVFHFSENQ